MAPLSYCYRPVPRDDNLNPVLMGCKQRWWLWILLALLALVLVILLGFVISYAAKANSKACKDGLQAEQECRNITHFLEDQLTQAKKALQRTEIQGDTCNRTVVTLMASLKKEKDQGHKQQEQVQKLQGEIAELKQKLKNASNELEQLRKETKTSDSGNDSTSFGNTINLSVVSMLLTLSLVALLA